MQRVQSETMYDLISRCTEKPAADTALDAGVIDAGTRAVIELNVSDADAVYHYVSHLMRIVAGCSGHFVMRPAHPVPKAEQQKEEKEERKKGTKVLVVDELLLFDVSHYATTVPSAAHLEGVGIIQDPDPFVCLGECAASAAAAA